MKEIKVSFKVNIACPLGGGGTAEGSGEIFEGSEEGDGGDRRRSAEEGKGV